MIFELPVFRCISNQSSNIDFGAAMSSVTFVISRVLSCEDVDYTVSVYEDAAGYFALWDCDLCHLPGIVPSGRHQDRESAITDCRKSIDGDHAKFHSAV
jgi:hypothetical protein